MIDINEIFKTASEHNAKKENARAIVDLIKCDKSDEMLVKILTLALTIDFTFILVKPDSVLMLINTTLAYGFSAGREYGKQEIIDQTIEKISTE